MTEPGAHVWIRTVPTDGRWCELCGLSEARWSGDPCPGEGAARAIEQQLIKARQALTYISSPTMGLLPGRDALDFVDEASEDNVRLALKACIGTARAALR